jgi:hypothetical protein
MSDFIPLSREIPGAGSGIAFDENDTMDQQSVIVILFLPETCVWTLKRDENGNVYLFFEDPTNKSWNDEHFSRWTKESKTSRFVPSKPMVRTHVISVFSWKFLPNNLGLGSIVFYGFAEGKKIQMHCGNNIKNTTTNPSTRVWDILNKSLPEELRKKLQVGIDMFSAIELEEATKNVNETFFNLESFTKQYNGDNFKSWMEPQCSHLNYKNSHAMDVFNISKKYSALNGEEFILSKYVILDSDGDMGASAYTGAGAILKLGDNLEEQNSECFQSHSEFEKTSGF